MDTDFFFTDLPKLFELMADFEDFEYPLLVIIKIIKNKFDCNAKAVEEINNDCKAAMISLLEKA